MKLPTLFVLLFVSVFADKARFDNYRVYRFTIENEEQYQAIKYLEEHSDSYNFWEPPILHQDMEVLVPPHMFAHFEEVSRKLSLNTELIINNFQELIDAESRPRKRKASSFVDWDSYASLDEIYTWLDDMNSKFPSFTSIRQVGTTHEGRPIKLFSISKKQGNRAVVIEANIHAREWISSATATYVINELLNSTDPIVKEMTETIDWHIITISNPDGFVYSKTDDRLWRKTRAPTSILCYGVDANRNFGYNFLVKDETGNIGASVIPCTNTYAGAYAFSEKEAQAIDSILSQYANITDLFLSFHSQGHYLLHPWGTTKQMPSNYANLTAVGTQFRDALRAVDGINYTVGSSNTVLYAASGTTPDHAYGAYGIPLAYTIEMRGSGPYGNFGHVLPPEFIKINSEEVFAGMVAMITEAKRLGYFGSQEVL